MFKREYLIVYQSTAASGAIWCDLVGRTPIF